MIDQYKETLKKAADKIKELSNQLKDKDREDEIAVIGYSCRFPGGANSIEQFWEQLSCGKDAVSEIDNSRFMKEKFFSADKTQLGKMYTESAAYLNVDYREFDFTHFEISATESESVDPMHKLLLEVSWEAIENAGLKPRLLKGSKTGVFIGATHGEFLKADYLSNDVQDITPYTMTGLAPSAASGRLSYFYDFTGPSVTCDTACSSSLIALNSAVESLRNGQCDMAIVGGVNLLMLPETFVGFCRIQGLSSDGRCKAFDESADGYGRGEGCGVIILKRRQDAENDSNDVHAIIKSVVVGQDGRSNGFIAPNGLSQQQVIRNALKKSGLSVDDIDYIEAHGTGTALGDAIEAQAISEVFRKKQKKMLIGSVKTNIAHLEAASGMAGIIKVILAMKHGKIPASLHFKNPSKEINWNKIQVVDRLTDWDKSNGKRRAGVSTFGFTGTLVHAILEEAPQEEKPTNLKELPCSVITLSAKTKDALRESINNLGEFIKNSQETIQNIGYTSNIIRSAHEHRFSIAAETKDEALNKIFDCLNNDDKYALHTSQVSFDRKGQSMHDSQSVPILSLSEGMDNYKRFFESVSSLFLNGTEIDWKELYKSYHKQRVVLPNYPFQRKRSWKELNS